MLIPFGYRKSASALILVLLFLVLLSGVIVAFFTTIQTETGSSKSYEGEVVAKQLAESANSVVMGQIADATQTFKTAPVASGSDGAAGPRVTWASQPGLIRTWDDTGAPWKLFKLYSAKTMVLDIPKTGYSASAQMTSEIPADWVTQAAVYTDLNEPVLIPDSANGKIPRDGGLHRAVYPVFDPEALGAVEGLQLNEPPGYGDGAGKVISTIQPSADPTVAAPGKTGNPAAMPTAWIYVLKDGTLTSPSSVQDGGRTAVWSGASGLTPTRENPIVGRIAFWTDDESCKLNINTSSEPTPWSTPCAITIQDLKYGLYQPASKEYQRYSGHPFMTALSPVFFPNTLTSALTSVQYKKIYDAIPRVQFGGTQGATVSVDPGANLTAVTPDNDRLFANVDELLFPPPAAGSAIRAAAPVAPIAHLRRLGFFLTANSRAPEVSVFGGPRISLWPESIQTRTAFDKLAAFCATLGAPAQKFYFQRQDPTSPTSDYLGISRNQDLYKYLQTVTGQNVPGYGGDFKTKWGGDRDQVLTEIFDYIRSVNLGDNSSGAVPYTSNGQVAPIQINSTKGFGRFQTVAEVGIHFICCQDGDKKQGNPPLADKNFPKPGTRTIQAGLLLEPFSPSLGWRPLNENICFQVTLNSHFSVDGVDLQFPSSTVLSSNGNFANIWHGREWGGFQGIRGALSSFGGGNYQLVSKSNPYTSISTANGKKTMNFSGGSVTIKIYSGTAPNAANLVQTVNVNFPAASFPIPQLVATGTDPYRGSAQTNASDWWNLPSRYGNANTCPHAPGPEYSSTTRRWGDSGGPPGFKTGGVFRAEDVVRTMVPVNGDLRIIAGRQNVDASLFRPGTHYNDTGRNLDHLFCEPEGPHLLYGFANEPGLTSPPGSELTAATYHYARNPVVVEGAGKFNKWGDFDNGFAHVIDGPYINKPDEGNVNEKAGYAYFTWDYVAPTSVIFSPSRLVPSPGVLGSLPTGVQRDQPWQTLLFRPQVGHPGAASPPDHMIMDLFWMPAVEPYAISEPFATAGKINLNYEIAPFTYIRRTTALHGVMKSEEPLLIPTNPLPGAPYGASTIYKLWDHQTNDWPVLPNDAKDNDPSVRDLWNRAFNGQAPFDKLRRPIDVEATLAQFDTKFTSGDVFHSASQICEVHLVRSGEKLSDYQGNRIWPNNLVTGDNTREKPYSNLYGRLTTKSNVYNVYVRAQALQAPHSPDPAAYSVWKERSSQILSEYRGATLIERYVDPADPNLPDFTSDPSATLDKHYRFRVLSTKRFSPQ